MAEKRTTEAWIGVALGAFFVGLSFFDLVGEDPDSGILDVGPAVLGWVVRGFGVLLIGAGLYALRPRGRRWR